MTVVTAMVWLYALTNIGTFTSLKLQSCRSNSEASIESKTGSDMHSPLIGCRKCSPLSLLFSCLIGAQIAKFLVKLYPLTTIVLLPPSRWTSNYKVVDQTLKQLAAETDFYWVKDWVWPECCSPLSPLLFSCHPLKRVQTKVIGQTLLRRGLRLEIVDFNWEIQRTVVVEPTCLDLWRRLKQSNIALLPAININVN